MKHLSFLKNLAVVCGTLAAAVAFSSCNSAISPTKAAGRLGSNEVAVFSHNTMNDPHNRECREAGPMPERTQSALKAWLRNSTVKNFSYANPQYYITVKDSKTGKERVWGICSDGQGNLVGVLIPRDGVKAWDLPPVGHYRMYVCDTNRRKVLSDAIMNSLAEAGYDTYRIDTLKSMGLTQQRYLISKPLSDAAQKRYDELKKQEMEQQNGKAAPKEEEETPEEDDDTDDADDDSDDDSGSDDDDSSGSDDDTFDDSGFDELGF